MKEMYKTLVKVYRYHENEFAIIRGLHDNIIRAINYKYIDENGQLNKPLNGAEMFVSTLDNTIEGIINRINSYFDWQDFLKENEVDTNNTDELLKAAVKFYKLA